MPYHAGLVRSLIKKHVVITNYRGFYKVRFYEGTEVRDEYRGGNLESLISKLEAKGWKVYNRA